MILDGESLKEIQRKLELGENRSCTSSVAIWSSCRAMVLFQHNSKPACPTTCIQIVQITEILFVYGADAGLVARTDEC